MGVFVCHKCKCIENTALGHWWSRGRIEDFVWTEKNEAHKGEGLCSECMPTEYSDGSGDPRLGEWHNKFPKQHIDEFLKSDSAKYYKLMPDGYLAYIANQ